uniref:Uncharacterized protein n=1 Tax=Rhizophora mucronata TaxID=61149 RepID=A0A2P2IH06_RHIMU
MLHTHILLFTPFLFQVFHSPKEPTFLFSDF